MCCWRKSYAAILFQKVSEKLFTTATTTTVRLKKTEEKKFLCIFYNKKKFAVQRIEWNASFWVFFAKHLDWLRIIIIACFVLLVGNFVGSRCCATKKTVPRRDFLMWVLFCTLTILYLIFIVNLYYTKRFWKRGATKWIENVPLLLPHKT